VFQVGANKGQTVSISIGSVSDSVLGADAADTNGTGYGNLRGLKSTSAAVTGGALAGGNALQIEDALEIVDAAIDEISVIRGDLGAFQANTLEANLDSLRVASENLQASESTIRDTDMASEMASFTKFQIMMQAGTAMLAQANQIPNNILQLLR
jgi:flagellin